jgi:hypothetical protein
MNYVIPNLTIEHNTAFSPSNASFIWDGQSLSPNQIIRNNLVGGPQYAIFSPLGQGTLAWNSAAGPGSVFAGNVVAYASDWFNVIPNNCYPQSFDAVGLVGGGAAATSTSTTMNSLVLSSTSMCHNTGTDGKDPGPI